MKIDSLTKKIIATLIIYLLCSFIAVSINPLDWWISGRIIFTIATIAIIMNDYE